MAKTTTVTITYDGVPLVGAQVLFGDYTNKWLTTDADGQITASLPDDFAALEIIAVKHENFEDKGGFIHRFLLIEAGESYTVETKNYGNKWN